MENTGQTRRLPRLRQGLTWLGILLRLVAMAVMIVAMQIGVTYLHMRPHGLRIAPPTDIFLRLLNLGVALLMIASACAWPPSLYRARLRHPGRAVAPRLETWQEQVAAALPLAALPLCSLAITLLFPPTNMLVASVMLMVVGALTVIEAFLLLAAQVWVIIANFS